MPQKMQTLTCRAGHTWQRPAQRGKPPHYCPKHNKAQRHATAAARNLPRIEPESELNVQLEKINAEDRQRRKAGIIEGTARPREMVHVADIQVGDWTHITQFRPVTAVKVYPRKKEVRLTWGSGEHTMSATYPFTVKQENPDWTPDSKLDRYISVPFKLRVLRAANV